LHFKFLQPLDAQAKRKPVGGPNLAEYQVSRHLPAFILRCGMFLRSGLRREREHVWRFRIFRTNHKGEAIDCVGVYDDLAAAKAHKRRSEWRYKVSVDGEWMTMQELDALEE
jgi:hypothetical protein